MGSNELITTHYLQHTIITTHYYYPIVMGRYELITTHYLQHTIIRLAATRKAEVALELRRG